VTFWRSGARTRAWWAAATLAVGLVTFDVAGYVQGGTSDWKTVFFLVTMSIALVTGLGVWAWRPQTHMGPLIYWWPALVVAGDLMVAYPRSRTAASLGLGLYTMGLIVFAQMSLSYPNGKLVSEYPRKSLVGRAAWFYIFIGGYAAQIIQNLYTLAVVDGRGCGYCVPAERSWFYIGNAPFSVDWWNRGWGIEILVVLPIGLAVTWLKFVRQPPGGRRTFLPIAVGGTIATFFGMAVLYFIVVANQTAFVSVSSYSWIQTAGQLGSALAVFIGLLVVRRARGPIGDLVVELRRASPGELRPALARAIGDPSLELALWLPERGTWADESGTEVSLPESRDRAVTYIGHDLAALVHDPVFLHQPALLEAVGSAARFALENEQLQAELRAQLAELRESRARIVRAGDEERRRLERDLHDGAQQRLLGIGMALQLLRSSGDPEAQRLLDETQVEVQAALAELRELARGIHPAVLTDHGLGAAVRTLAERAPVPVQVTATDERFPGEIETAVYFIVAEALTNVAKHADASKVWVTVERMNGAVHVEVRDDGGGGAGLDGGGGLRGLADRAGALDGRLAVDSPPGGGTRVSVEIPCAS
jgi:signal transduction histidine kinase